MEVKKVMYKELYKIASTESVFVAAKLLQQKNVGSLLVEENKTIVGIVTERDFIRKVIAAEKSPKWITVKSIMSTPLIMINANADIIEAGRMLARYKIKRLVVVENGKIKGIISASIIGNHIKRIISSY